MKKYLFAVAFLVFFSQVIYGNILLGEEFDYTVGDALGDVEGWTTTGTITSGEGRTISDVSLSYSNNGGEYIMSGGSKSLKHAYSSGEDYITYRNFDKQTSGVVYLTYMYKPDGKQGQSNGELLGLATGTSVSARPWAGKLSSGDTSGATYRLGLTFQSGKSGDIKWGSEVYDINDVLLIVLKYDLDSHSASLFVNPTLGTDEEPTPNSTDNVVPTGSSARTNINTVMFRNQGSSKSNYYVGGVRVSTTWAEAVAIATAEPEAELDRVVTNFNDGTWGEIATADYSAGNYPNITINGLVLTNAGMRNGTNNYTETSENFINRIVMEGAAGIVTLPAVSSASQVIVYASAGTADKKLKLQSYNFRTQQWADIDTYSFSTTDCYRFVTEINSREVTKLRFVNVDNGKKFIWKIQTCPMPPLVDREGINFVFSDDVWSGMSTSATHASETVNEVDFAFAARQNNSVIFNSTGEKFDYRVQLAGKSDGNIASVTLPPVASAAQIAVYASAGSRNKNLILEQYNYGLLEWEQIDTYNFEEASVCYCFSTVLNTTSATHLRIVNNEGGVKNIAKIVVYGSAPVGLTVPTALAATNVSSHAFAANWSAVDGATGYRIVVSKADDNSVVHRKVVDANVTSLPIDKLTEATEYYYQVAAIGDDVAMTDSYLSARIAVTTTADAATAEYYTRSVTAGNYGTICLPRACEDLLSSGGVFFAVAGKVLEAGKLKEVVFEEVTTLEAGRPYVFLASASEINVPMTGDAVGTAGSHNGLIGSFEVKKVSKSEYNYVLSNNLLYCAKNTQYYVGENRAYFKIDEIPEIGEVAPVQGKRQVRMSVAETDMATALEDTGQTTTARKLILDGRLLIEKDGRYYDALGNVY